LKFIVEQTLQIVPIPDIYVLQGSVETRLQYARIFDQLYSPSGRKIQRNEYKQ